MKSYDAVVCGAGIAGAAVAYHLAVSNRVSRVLVVDSEEPLTVTSNKGTQGYRNWWPGPDNTMMQLVDRSIEIMEELARESNNVFRMNRRGYLFVTGSGAKLQRLSSTADDLSDFGMGPVRTHSTLQEYRPHMSEGFDGAPDGCDILYGNAALQAFPYLSKSVKGVLHVRKAGWLNASALGWLSLMRAFGHGAEFRRDRLVGVEIVGGRVVGVRLEGGGLVPTGRVVFCGGPMLQELLPMVGAELPLIHELHAKVCMSDRDLRIPRNAPFLIWADPIRLRWDRGEESGIMLDGEDELLGRLPGGLHVRPHDSRRGNELFLIWTYENKRRKVAFPPVFSKWYGAAVLRGVATMVPTMQGYWALPRKKIFVDGGYYCKTRENRPLAGALPLQGAYVCGALSGSGVMMAHALGELVAAKMTGSELPPYAHWFAPARYSDPVYRKLSAKWGSRVGQL